MVRGSPKISLIKIWLSLGGALGGMNFCNYKPPCKSLNLFLRQAKKTPDD